MTNDINDIFGDIPSTVEPAQVNNRGNLLKEEPAADRSRFIDKSLDLNALNNPPKPEPPINTVSDKKPEPTVLEEEFIEEEVVVDEDDDLVEDAYKLDEIENIDPSIGPKVVPDLFEKANEEDDNETEQVEDTSTADIELVDDNTPDDEDGSVFEAIVKDEFDPILKNTQLLFNKLSDIPTPSAETESAIAMLKELKHYGEYIDIYLPVSNIGVRVYEFENNTFFNENFQRIFQWVEDIDYLSEIKSAMATKKLMDYIKNNCVFLCKDSSSLNNGDVINQLSKHDIDLLLLGTTALLVYLENDRKDWKYTISAQCPKCNNQITIGIDLLDLFRKQYDKMTDEERQAVREYSMEETFAEKLKKSKHGKKRRVGYSRGNGKDAREVHVYVSDPSYKTELDVEENVFNYIINRYQDIVGYYTRSIYGYNSNTTRRKIGLLIDAINRDGNLANEDIVSLSKDLQLSTILPYIHRVEFSNYGNNSTKKVFQLTDMSSEEKLGLVGNLPEELFNKVLKAVTNTAKQGVETIKISYECAKCHEESVAEYPPVYLFLFAVNLIRERLS